MTSPMSKHTESLATEATPKCDFPAFELLYAALWARRNLDQGIAGELRGIAARMHTTHFAATGCLCWDDALESLAGRRGKGVTQ